MSQLILGETNYDPNKEYYFLDYHDSMEVRWVRSPYMTLEEIQVIVSDHLPFIYDEDEKKCVPMFSNLRITPMKQLEELYKVWNEETQQWEDDTITLAAKQFGARYDRYDCLGEEGPSPAPSLTKTNDETTEEWKVRVQQRRDELEEQRKEQSSLRRQTREKALENCSNEQVALLFGSFMRKDELSPRSEEAEEENSQTSGVGFG